MARAISSARSASVTTFASAAFARGRPRSGHDGSHTTLIEYISDFPVRVGVNKPVLISRSISLTTSASVVRSSTRAPRL